MTPPHLRNFHNAGRDAEPPLTPTLPAVTAENEDVFLGSSPTPGIRNRPQSSQSRLASSQREKTPNTPANVDPPSSPPTLKSPSSNARQEPQLPAEEDNSVTKTTKSHKRQGKQSEKDRKNATHIKEKPVSKRLRSSAKKKSTPDKKASKNRKSSMQSEEASESIRVETPNNESSGVGNSVADSFNDDVESQVASQLELDLEHAVDHEGKQEADASKSTDLPDSFPMTRKRKRGVEEAQTPPITEKRRSTRKSSSQPAATDITPEPRGTRNTRSSAPASQQDDTTKSSPAQSAGKRRKGQVNLDAAKSTELMAAEQEQVADNNAERVSQMWESSQSQRRSTRLGAIAEQPAAEESPRKRSRRERRARARQASREKRQQTQEASQEVSQETSQIESQVPDSHPEEQPVVENIAAQEAVEQEGEKEQDVMVEQDEAQASPRPSPPQEQPAEIQPEAEMDRTEVQSEQTTTEPDVEMGDAETGLETNTSAQAEEEHAIAQATPTEQAIDAPSEREADASQSGIIRSFEQTLNNLKSTTLDENSLRQLDDLLFRIRVEAHDAFRRHTG